MSTIRDVARAAGVSIATVSRVYTRSSPVREDTVRRVLAAATRLDYWPHAGARSLTTNRSHALGVLLPDLFGQFYSEVIRGIDSAARACGYQVLLSSSHASTDALLAAARAMRGRVDGMIVMAPQRGFGPAVRQIAESFRVVLLNSRSGFGGCATVSIANFEGASTVVRHLHALGHRRIAILRGPSGNVDAEERLRGFRAALESLGLDRGVELPGDFAEESGYRRGQELLRLRPRPTAVFAANDNMALGLLSAAREGGLRVPEDLAVVGFDDIAAARYLDPPLSTVRVDAFELGRRAVERWIQADERKNGEGASAVREVIPTALVVRGSCGGPAPAAAEAEAAAALSSPRPHRPSPRPHRPLRPSTHSMVTTRKPLVPHHPQGGRRS